VTRTPPGSNGAARSESAPEQRELALLHWVPGRLRLRSAALRGHPERAAELEARLRSRPGVRSASANPLTGSVLVLYDPPAEEPPAEALQRIAPEADPAELARWTARGTEALERAARGARASAPSERVDWGERIAAASRRFNESIARSTGGADLEVLLPAVLALLGAYRMSTERLAAPRWYEFFWFAFNAFNTLHRERRS
jgi:hypothetical protein